LNKLLTQFLDADRKLMEAVYLVSIAAYFLHTLVLWFTDFITGVGNASGIFFNMFFSCTGGASIAITTSLLLSLRKRKESATGKRLLVVAMALVFSRAVADVVYFGLAGKLLQYGYFFILFKVLLLILYLHRYYIVSAVTQALTTGKRGCSQWIPGF